MADWGVDMVKAQGCFLHYEEFDEAYVMMGFALNSTGRRINYACDWPAILLRNGEGEFTALTFSSRSFRYTFVSVRPLSHDFCPRSHPLKTDLCID